MGFHFDYLPFDYMCGSYSAFMSEEVAYQATRRDELRVHLRACGEGGKLLLLHRF